ncbi:transcription factor E4F1-like [Anopheles cruzii]|uniref:transcription factor E4F1-like n=1 Tax=Anopheles cruzii TaxID=68878 RepID=UPI0022EC4D53|nr:transcription factor E4F1-like [Anopheles cruzii]
MDTNSLLNMNLALNVARKCRICGMDILDLSCAFSIFGSDRLDHKIERYLQLNIQADDLLPKCICGSCYLKLESIDQFALMANRTEDAFRAWIRRLRGLNCSDEPVQNVNLVLPLFRPQQSTAATDCSGDQKSNIQAFHMKEQQQQQQRFFVASGLQKPVPAANFTQGNITPAEVSTISYSDLKLGLLIKDQELLKLILKALKWAENDRRASFDVLIQRLKNSSFREILSNHNLLNDGDLTQLLKSYIGQGVMNSFTSPPATASTGATVNANVPPPLVLSSSIVPPAGNVLGGHIGHFKLAPVPPQTAMGAGNTFKIDDASVTQMEVGIDPDLYLPYDDEDSSSATKFDHRFDDRQDNTVTIKLVTTSDNSEDDRKMIPAILNVRSSNRFQCSVCPECFATNGELQQHIVQTHLPTARPMPLMSEHGKPAIKIRVRKTKHLLSAPPLQPTPVKPLVSSPVETVSKTPPPLTIVPLKIPASTTITVVPVSKPQPSTGENVKSVPVREPLQESPPKVELTRKSQRKPVKKVNPSSPVPSHKQKVTKAKKSTPTPVEEERHPVTKVSRRTPSAFCTVCRKTLPARESIRDHMERQHSRFECEKCGRAFKSAVNLARHQQCHAGVMVEDQSAKTKPQNSPGDELHKCTHCDKVFRKLLHLKLHLNNHHNESKSTVKPSSTGAAAGTVTSLRKRTPNGAIAGSSVSEVGRTKRKSTITRK